MEIFNPSRIEPIGYPGFSPLRQVHILRDDIIHPIVCGNKWRKLKFVIEYFLRNKYEKLVTFGGAYSNHVVAVAFAGNHFGIHTHAFIRGDEVREPNHYEQLCIENKMTLQHVSRADYKDKRKLFDTYFGDDAKAFFLDEGGDHPLALYGCADTINELDRVYDYIILPLGTGTTMEGLLQGIVKNNLPTKAIGISSLKNNLYLDKRMEKYNRENRQIFHEYHRGKYGKTDDGLLDFIKDFKFRTNITLEPVYTGKMMMGFIDLIENGFFKPDDKILLVHTGGLLNV